MSTTTMRNKTQNRCLQNSNKFKGNYTTCAHESGSEIQRPPGYFTARSVSPYSDSNVSTAPSTPRSGGGAFPPPPPQQSVTRNSKVKGKKKDAPLGADSIGLDLCAVYSRGSKNHVKGQCRPCHKIRMDGGCSEGENCNFCHYAHENASAQQTSMSATKVIDEKPVERKTKIPLDEPWYVPLPVGFRAPPGLLPPGLPGTVAPTSLEQVALMRCSF